ncbi:methyltransferase [Oligoflexus tunisiensis]|uniref:methyltransferase n=1 Tax=Oligoflexus tunisiensis TaxID=708132 RepID=UPI001C404377|nr:methyltransferase [Oligoflexus tunisiensis]
MNLNSRRKLKPKDADRFADAEPALFRELAKVVCATGMLPQKELHECWQMANVVHKTFPESLHIADMAAGHGLLAWILVLLARSSEIPILRTAVAVDINRPKSADALAVSITDRWPNLVDAVHYVEGSIDAVIAEDGPGTLLVAAHACGSLSDRVLLAAITSRCPVAIMPCCHSLRKQAATLSSLALASGLPPSAAAVGNTASIDQFRIDALAALGYQISEGSIQTDITPFNRIIMGKPPRETSHSVPVHQVSGSGGRVKRLGEIRAFEKIQSLNVANIEEAQALSKRPSREWLRSFDLSYWVDDEAMGHRIAATLDFLTQRFQLPQSSGHSAAPAPVDAAMVANITIRDQYIHPTSQRLAFTYRIEIRSSTVVITKDDAALLRKKLCRALRSLAQMHHANFALRGE